MTALARASTAPDLPRLPLRTTGGAAGDARLPRPGDVALFRRPEKSQGDMQGTSPFMGKVRFGCCVLDDGRGTLKAPDGTETVLRPKTLDLLRLMLRNPGRVVARQDILDAVWPNLFVTDDSITQCVVELRKAMGGAGPDLLKTVPRRGYLMTAEIEIEAANANVPLLGAVPGLPADRPSIAVLPFRKDGADPQDAYFADGIIEGIVHVLSGLERITVVSRGSALALAESTVDPREVGQRLGVGYVLYGGVRRSGERLRITTELSETGSGTVIRVDRHDGDTSDLFALQDRISEQVVATIAPQVRARELALALRKPPASLTAYDLVLRALDKVHRLDRRSLEDGRELLEQAIAADPGFGLAHSYLGWFYSWRIMQGWSPDVVADQDAADRAAAAALERDPGDGFAIALRGILLGYTRRDYVGAQRLLDQAVSTSPSCALAWSWGSLVRAWTGDGQAAVTWAERGLQLAPIDPFTFFHDYVLGQAHYVAGDYEKAAAHCRSSGLSQPEHAAVWRTLAVSLVALGRLDEARAAARRVLAVDPGFRLAPFAARTPLGGWVRDSFVDALRTAGLPD
jgi:adenylate cyclase